MFLFLVLINAAGFRENLKNVGSKITLKSNKKKPMPRIHLKYIDDMTVAESLNLKKQLINNPELNPPRPLQYHERTGHILPEGLSEVQIQLNEIKAYSEEHQMKINEEKTKVILFNRSRKYDFMPECYINLDENLQVVEELKLLGVIIRSDLSWATHCNYMCKRAFARLWMLRRLKPLGANVGELLEVYNTQIRSILEFAVAAWNPGLTTVQVSQIERVQKCAFAIILGSNFSSYSNSLQTLDMKSLNERRKALCLNFAKKAVNHEKYSKWFCPNINQEEDTRSKKTNFKPVHARKSRFKKSPLSYLTRLLNEN